MNSVDMTGKSQDEVVAILRNTKRGSTVKLCVSRVDPATDSNTSLPRQIVRVNYYTTASLFYCRFSSICFEIVVEEIFFTSIYLLEAVTFQVVIRNLSF